MEDFLYTPATWSYQFYCEAALKPKMSDPGLEIATIFHPILILIFQQSGCRREATQSRRHICPAGGKWHSFTACSHIYQTCLQTHTSMRMHTYTRACTIKELPGAESMFKCGRK